MRIDIEEIRELHKRRSEINNVLLSTIDFYENGVKVEITPEVLEEWRFVGLSNCDFILMDAYKEEEIHSNLEL